MVSGFSLVRLLISPGCLAALALGAALCGADAQELRAQATPFSAWLDFQALARPNPPKVPLPIWLEALETEVTPATADSAGETIYRLRLRRMAHLNPEVAVRVFFDDLPGHAPTVSAWSETSGTAKYLSGPLGSGVGLPTSMQVAAPVQDADYIDITTPGDGFNVRGVFISTLRRSEKREAVDFAEPEVGMELDDAFGNVDPMRSEDFDSYLFGRVKAALHPETLALDAESPGGNLVEFELDRKPLLAVVTFEIVNANISTPPDIFVNGRLLGPATLLLPDLADPAFRGEVKALEADLRFRYTGWLRAQKVIPGSILKAGLNQLEFGVTNLSGSTAVRTVELQLKHNWKNFDYSIAP